MSLSSDLHVYSRECDIWKKLLLNEKGLVIHAGEQRVAIQMRHRLYKARSLMREAKLAEHAEAIEAGEISPHEKPVRMWFEDYMIKIKSRGDMAFLEIVPAETYEYPAFDIETGEKIQEEAPPEIPQEEPKKEIKFSPDLVILDDDPNDDDIADLPEGPLALDIAEG